MIKRVMDFKIYWGEELWERNSCPWRRKNSLVRYLISNEKSKIELINLKQM